MNSDGTQGDGRSGFPSLSADGRLVAFSSSASNLVAGDTNDDGDIFVHDRLTGLTELVSVASDGTQGLGSSRLPSINADGRFVAFFSFASNLVPGDTNELQDIFVHDRQTGDIERVSVLSASAQGNDRSYDPAISAAGRFVAFWSQASNLVAEDRTDTFDVFIRDREAGVTRLVSARSIGVQGNADSWSRSISADGRFVVFWSRATNLVAGDTNFALDVFLQDRALSLNERVSVASDGTQANLDSWAPSVNADGRFVAFFSDATNLVQGDTNVAKDVFVHDRETGATRRVSVAADGIQGNGASSFPALSADGRYVAFQSESTNLVPGDTNGVIDVFVYDLVTKMIERVSLAADGAQGNGNSSSFFFTHISHMAEYPSE